MVAVALSGAGRGGGPTFQAASLCRPSLFHFWPKHTLLKLHFFLVFVRGLKGHHIISVLKARLALDERGRQWDTGQICALQICWFLVNFIQKHLNTVNHSRHFLFPHYFFPPLPPLPVSFWSLFWQARASLLSEHFHFRPWPR